MPLDFPSSPVNGQVYNGYYWDASSGVWRKQFTFTDLTDLDDVTISSPAEGQFLVYDGPTSQWKNETITYSYSINDLTSLNSTSIITAPNYDIGVTTSTNPGTYNLDFSGGTGLFNISTNGALTFTGSNYRAGAIKTARIANSTASAQNLTFPANWKFVGVKPTTIKASKVGVLTITSFTTADTGCIAAYTEEL